MQFRGQRISVGGTTQDDQYMLFEPGAEGRARFQGDIEMELSSRVRFTFGNFRTLGWMGQSPATSNAQLAIRVQDGMSLSIDNGYIDNFSTWANTTGASANVAVDSSGRFRRSSSASRYKLDQQELEVPESLIDIPLIDWIDRGEYERRAQMDEQPRPFTEKDQSLHDAIQLRRIPGVVAETVKEYGGEQFITYGPDGQIEEVLYDRLALARTGILYRIIQAAFTEIKALQARVTELEGAAA